MDAFIALLCILVVIWLAWRKQQISTFKKLGVSGPAPNLIFGNILELYMKGPLQCHKEWVEKYGRVLGYYYGMKPVLLVTDPQLLKNIFIKDFSKFINREAFNPIGRYNPHDKDTQSVLNLPGQLWKDVRSVLTPTFTAAKMKQMAGSMNSSIEDMLKQMQESANKGEVLDAFDTYQRLTMDVITRTAFGIRTDVQTNKNSKMLRATKILFRTPYRDTFIFLGLSFPLLRRICIRLQIIFSTILNFGLSPAKMLRSGISDVIEYRRKNPQGKKADLLQLMIDSTMVSGNTEMDMTKLEAGNVEIEQKFENKNEKEDSSKNIRAMTDDEIIATAFTVLLAGYETTSTALAFTTYFLAKHQDVQETLFLEIKELIQNGQKLEYATVNKLPFLDNILNESMRIFPPVNLFTNRYALEDVQYGDLKIPKGTLIQAPVYLMHHDPEFWTDPETFDPERFSNKPNSDGITYLPFGVGPRNCLGMRFAQLESKLALAHVIYKFRFKLAAYNNDLQIGIRIRTLTPENGVHITLESRDVESAS
ncbi:hypothetical protein JTE90_009916 [Oedothorax gibbosus]|uniref:Cytochrome P450 n=1 Tax=Oedothorax gibbosus TaxID=931172 RepID=A0AAV6UW48_9ARAC|nr:hypothetical protein JTE90_009916 [Oedothorax gibbosus]